MKSASADKIHITSYDDLFGTGSDNGEYDIQNIPLDQLYSFHKHPFHVNDDERMEELTASVREYGILTPGRARPLPSKTGYEIISGHRRKRACELAGLTEMPFLIEDMGDDEAAVRMVDSNLQREDILPSEKAFAFKMKYDALAHQGKKAACSTAELIGENSGDSARTVQRYIRLTDLTEKLLALVDKGKISLGAGECLSYLSYKEQEWLYEIVEDTGIMPSGSLALKLKAESRRGVLTEKERIYTYFEKKDTAVQKKIVLPKKKLDSYFSEEYTQEQIETIIYRLLDKWSSGGDKNA